MHTPHTRGAMRRTHPIARLARQVFALCCTTAATLALAEPAALKLPYAQAGLDRRQAAMVLLDRTSHGARPGEVDRVLAIGIERWLAQQLAARQSETRLAHALAQYPAVKMSAAQLAATFPSTSLITAEARRLDMIPPADAVVDAAWRERKLNQLRKERGYQDQEKDLYRELVGQKVARALHAENQLQEVMSGFWQNHFHASSSSFRSRPWMLPYETQAIRPHAMGHFRDLLGVAVKHPAIIQAYQDGAQAGTLVQADTLMAQRIAAMQSTNAAHAEKRGTAIRGMLRAHDDEADLILPRKFWPGTGPNPDYARAVMSLYTLGDDRAYTPQDVEEAARVFTGWASHPIGPSAAWFKAPLASASDAGFVRQGDFLFRADLHDARPKQWFGLSFQAGSGIEEGERVLDTLARHPATAQHIAGKLAQRFVGEAAPATLVNRLAQRFQASDGDIRAVLRTLFESPEFWQAAATRQQVKTPFEFAMSALRATNAQVADTGALTDWLGRMGQPPYAFLAVAGQPDRDAQWANAAAMLNRIGFATSLASNSIEGVRIATSPQVLRNVLQQLPARDAAGVREALAAFDGHNTVSPLAVMLASPSFQTR